MITLTIKEDIEILVETMLKANPNAYPNLKDPATAKQVIVNAAKIARNAIVDDGYWEYLQLALEEALEEAQKCKGA